MEDSSFQHLLTTNNKEGKAIFTDLEKYPKHKESPFGATTHVWTTTEVLPDVSYNTRVDLDSSNETSQSGLQTMKGRIVPDNGMSAAILELKPGATTPMHRTRTVDVGIVLEGEIEMRLDSGEVRTLKKGDTFVQRGTNHEWTNVSDKDFKMFAVAIDAKPVIGADGQELGEIGL